MASVLSQRNIIATVVGAAYFMQNLDGTIVASTLPQMAIALHESPIHLSIVIIAYLLGVAVFIPASGKMADLFGARTIFVTAICVFTAGTISCGLSENLTALTCARVFQAVGAAFMVPVGQLVLLRATAKSELVWVMTFIAMVSQAGQLLGPPLGEVVTTFLSWHWVFFLNAPIGIAAIVLSWRFIENRKEPVRVPMDWAGFLLNGTALASLMYGLSGLGRGTTSMPEALEFVALGSIAGAIAIWHSRRHPHPQIDFSLFRLSTFRMNFTGGLLFRIGSASVPFLVPLLFQIGFGMTAFASGLYMAAMAIGALSIMFAARPAVKRFGFKRLLVGNEIITAGLIAACAFLTVSTPAPAVVVLLLLTGFSYAMQFTTLNTLSFSEVPSSRLSSATTLSNLCNQISNGSAVAVAASVLNLSLVWRNAGALETQDVSLALISVAAISVVSVFLFATLPRDAGREAR